MKKMFLLIMFSLFSLSAISSIPDRKKLVCDDGTMFEFNPQGEIFPPRYSIEINGTIYKGKLSASDSNLINLDEVGFIRVNEECSNTYCSNAYIIYYQLGDTDTDIGTFSEGCRSR